MTPTCILQKHLKTNYVGQDENTIIQKNCRKGSGIQHKMHTGDYWNLRKPCEIKKKI